MCRAMSKKKQLVMCSVALVLLLTACGGGSSAGTSPTPRASTPTAGTSTPSGGFPTVYKDILGGLVGLTVLAQGQRVTVIGELQAADGTTGGYSATFVDMRTSGGTVRCGGKTYNGPFTQDQSGDLGIVQVGIHGWGLLVLTLHHHTAAYQDGGHGPPLCREWRGTYLGGRHLEGKSGSFIWTDTLTLQ